MDFFFIILLFGLLVLFGYAQLHKNVFKLPGDIQLDEEDGRF